MTDRTRKHCQRGGVSFIELAVVALVLTVLMGAYFNVSNAMRAHRQNQQLQLGMAAIAAALRAYALEHGHLPCPDLSGAGWEGDGSGHCPAGVRVGGVPYAALSMEAVPVPGGSVRLGVWRGAGKDDLVQPPPLDGKLYPQGTQQYLQPLLLAAQEALAGAGPGQPYVAARNAAGQALDCGAPTLWPAFVLAVQAGSAATDALCFSAAQGLSDQPLAVGRAEFLGWLRNHSL